VTWRTIPKDDAWKQVTLPHVEGLGQRVWVHCHCGRQRLLEPSAFAADVGVLMETPLLSIAIKLRCSACGEKHVQVWPEPYGIGRA